MKEKVFGERMRLQLHDPIGPISHGMVASGDRILFIAGQVPVGFDGMLVASGDLGGQYKQVMENMRAIVEDAGGVMDDVCSLVNYVTVPLAAESEEYLAMASVRRE